jgi:hypothetical protein
MTMDDENKINVDAERKGDRERRLMRAKEYLEEADRESDGLRGSYERRIEDLKQQYEVKIEDLNDKLTMAEKAHEAEIQDYQNIADTLKKATELWKSKYEEIKELVSKNELI